MTVVDAYMGQGPFKDEFHPMMGYQHFAPPHPTSKVRWFYNENRSLDSS